MNRPQLMGARREDPAAKRDTTRAHMLTAKQIASTEVYAGRQITIGLPEGGGPSRVTLTGAKVYAAAVVLEFRYRDGRTSSRQLDPATRILIHRLAL